MSKHIVPPTSLDDERTVWIQPDPDPKSDPGWRLRLDWQRDDLAGLFEEQVLPERVDRPDAHRVLCAKASISLTRENAAWLRDALSEYLGAGATAEPVPADELSRLAAAYREAWEAEQAAATEPTDGWDNHHARRIEAARALLAHARGER